MKVWMRSLWRIGWQCGPKQSCDLLTFTRKSGNVTWVRLVGRVYFRRANSRVVQYYMSEGR
jgi:hypothetical protein